MAEVKGKGVVFFVALPALLIGSLFATVIFFATGGSSAAACTGAAGTADPDNVPTEPVGAFQGEQLSNAAYIMNAASELGLQRNAQVIGVMTAIGESSLRVLDKGDAVGPDSRGLFQQRDNGAWGSYEDRMDPTISSTNFFKALMGVEGWEALEPTLAIHKVQRNADPYHYEKFFDDADAIVTALDGDGSGGAGCTSGDVVPPLSPGYNMTSDYGPRDRPVAGASSWHPAIDLQHWPNPCGDQIYAITDGTVTYVGGYQVTIKAPEGYDVSYLHMKLSDVSVSVGDVVTPNQPIALVGSEGPSSGCHLDLRIKTTGTTNADVAALPDGKAKGGSPNSYGFVDPVEFYNLFGINICPPESCRNQSGS